MCTRTQKNQVVPLFTFLPNYSSLLLRIYVFIEWNSISWKDHKRALYLQKFKALLFPFNKQRLWGLGMLNYMLKLLNGVDLNSYCSILCFLFFLVFPLCYDVSPFSRVQLLGGKRLKISFRNSCSHREQHLAPVNEPLYKLGPEQELRISWEQQIRPWLPRLMGWWAE